MKEYYELLKEQYSEAKGIIPEYAKKEDIKKWIDLRQKMSDVYLNLLKQTGLLYSRDKELVETGKGCLDSVAELVDSATIITPHTLNFDILNEHRIIKGELKVKNCTPLLYKKDENGLNNIKAIEKPLLLMTQNPYNSYQIRNWDQLHNSTQHGIIVGVYGDNYDKDKISKINLLRELRSKLEGDVFEDLIPICGAYYYIVGTKEKIKTNKYTRK